MTWENGRQIEATNGLKITHLIEYFNLFHFYILYGDEIH